MEETPVTTMDLVNMALAGKPANMDDAFNSLVMPRIADAVGARKHDLAHAMFSDEQEEQEEDQTEEGSDQEETTDELEQQEDNEATDEEDTQPDA